VTGKDRDDEKDEDKKPNDKQNDANRGLRVEGNLFWGNGGAGISIPPNTSGRFIGNQSYENKGPGFEIREDYADFLSRLNLKGDTSAQVLADAMRFLRNKKPSTEEEAESLVEKSGLKSQILGKVGSSVAFVANVAAIASSSPAQQFLAHFFK
jgi:hypothetical protein